MASKIEELMVEMMKEFPMGGVVGCIGVYVPDKAKDGNPAEQTHEIEGGMIMLPNEREKWK